MLSFTSPETVAERLAAKIAARPTILINMDGTTLETEDHFAWSDALVFLWSGDGPAPSGPAALVIREADFARGTVVNVTDIAARQLCARTHDEGHTPGHLRAWLEWSGFEPFVADDDRLPLRRAGRAVLEVVR